MANGIFLSKPIFFLSLFGCFAIILLVGLLAGLLTRPTKCKDSTTTTTTTFNPNTITKPTISEQTINPTTQPYDPNGIRLPKDIIPVNYNLNVKAFYEPIQQIGSTIEDKFEGTVVIDFILKKSSNMIILHCDSNIKIQDSIQIRSLITNQLINVPIDQTEYQIDSQFFKIYLNNQIQTGNYSLKLDYTSNYGPSSNIVGFYKTSYYEDGLTKNIVATKFQPIDARKAFPCFDEPELKATFEIILEHPFGSRAFSNWPEKPRENIGNNRYRTRFEKTYPMSTYLAAWAILPDDFGYEEGYSKRGTKLRVMARKAAVEKGLVKFALEVGIKSIDFFQTEYFDEDLKALPPKTDMIAFPDFSSGAMEHWGIIGYRETSLLYSDDKNSVANKQSVAFVVAHELAHFWFGNLVTCKWWDDLWLNEAMARFLQFKAIESIYPDWDVENQFITLYKIPVMYDDGFQTSVPVSVEINTPAQIGSAFSSITYDKGSSLLRMLESTVGPQNFIYGLNNFLRNNQFSSAVAADFYNSLQLPPQMTDITPQEYMEQWLLQKNYPIVYTELETNPSNGNTIVKFKQNRFLLSDDSLPGLVDNSPFGFKWPIYLKCRAGGFVNPKNRNKHHLKGRNNDFNFFLVEKEGSIELDSSYSWIKCNKDFKGYYVTDYPIEIYEAFNELLINNAGGLTIGDRSNLIHVSYTLAYLGTKSYAIPAMLTNYLEYWEKDYVPWRTFTWHMSKIASLLERRPTFLELKGFGEYLQRILFGKLDIWDTDSGEHSEKLLKINAIDFICRLQEEKCLNRMSDIFDKINPDYFYNPNDVVNSVAPNLRSLVYKYHVQNTYNYEDTFKLYDVYQNSIDPQEKSNLLNALAQTRSTWIFDFYFDELLAKDSKIRAQDFFNFVIYIARNPNGKHMAWYFIREYWYEIVGKFGLYNRALANAVKSVCETFENVFLFEEMQEFFSISNPGAGVVQRQQSIDIVIHNILWILEREQSVKENLFIPGIKKMFFDNNFNSSSIFDFKF